MSLTNIALNSPRVSPLTQNTSIFKEVFADLEVFSQHFSDGVIETFDAFDKKNDKNYVVRFHPNPQFIKNEYELNRACHAMGLSVLPAKLEEGNWQGKTGSFLVLDVPKGGLEIGKILTFDPKIDRPICERLGKDFIVCSLFCLWDTQNIIFSTSGQHHYVSALFKFKHASESEIVWLRNNSKDCQVASYLYQFLTREEIQQQINGLDLSPLTNLVRQGDLSQEIFNVIVTRSNWLKSLNLKSFEEIWKSLEAPESQTAELKTDYENILSDHFSARWISNRKYALRKSGLSSAEIEEQVQIEYRNSIPAQQELEEIIKKANKSIKAFDANDFIQTLDDPTKISTFEKYFKYGHLIKRFTSSFQSGESFQEPEFDIPEGFSSAAGVLILLPNNKVVLVEPAGAFLGSRYVFPKGRKEPNETLQEAAIREAKEETGLDIRLKAFFGDYQSESSYTRYYLAEIIGGDPGSPEWETDRVYFVPYSQLLGQLNLNQRKFALVVANDLVIYASKMHTA